MMESDNLIALVKRDIERMEKFDDGYSQITSKALRGLVERIEFLDERNAELERDLGGRINAVYNTEQCLDEKISKINELQAVVDRLADKTNMCCLSEQSVDFETEELSARIEYAVKHARTNQSNDKNNVG